MKVNLKQVTFSYTDNDRKETKSEKIFPVSICPAESYKTEYEKDFYDLNKDNHLLCADNKEVFLQGTRDSRVSKKDHSYLIYEFAKCQGVGCAEPEQINQWLNTKSVHMRVLNDKIDFTKFDEGSIRQNEIWLPSVKFKPGLFTD